MTINNAKTTNTYLKGIDFLNALGGSGSDKEQL